MAVTITATLLSIVSIYVAGFYPGIIVLVAVALIPIASRFYAGRIGGRSAGFQKKYFTALTIVNVLSVLVVLWMAFVIVHDRILLDC